MRKLMLILIAFIAAITFIRAFDNAAGIHSNSIYSEDLHPVEAAPITAN